MSSARPKIVLDEQSFQGLLAAAFTIQQHNDRYAANRPDLPAEPPPARTRAPKLCAHCGLPLAKDGAPCPACGTEPLRAGEHLQQLWASMWQVSQERGLAPQARKATPPAVPPADGSSGPGMAPSSITGSTSAPAPRREWTSPLPPDHLHHHASGPDFALDSEVDPEPGSPGIELSPDKPWPSPRQQDSRLSVPLTAISRSDGPPGGGPPGDDPPDHLADVQSSSAQESSPGSTSGLAALWARLRSHRANLYLGTAVLVAAVALLWPASRPQAPTLSVWDRFLVAIGIAEVSQPAVHFQGDPNIKVWVDTHTALYYCPGEDLYGKSPDGHYSTQHDAQSDRFEPAERSVCVP